MAGPWEKYGQPAVTPTPENTPQGPWAKYAQPQQPAPSVNAREYSDGGWLPISRDPQTGEVGFDIRGGVTGAILEAVGGGASAMKDVAEGRLDPTSQEAVNRTRDAALLATPMSPGVMAAEKVIPGTLKSLRVGKPKVPTTQELKAAGGAGFDKARQMGVDYSAHAVKSLANDLIGQLEKDGFRDATAGKTLGILRELQVPPAGAEGESVLFTLDDLIAARRTLQELAGAGGSDGEAARRSVKALDDFVIDAGVGKEGVPDFSGGLPVGDAPPRVVAGPAAAAGKVVEDARANYAAHFRSKDVEKSVLKAEQDAAAANSGANTGNRIRQRLKSILQSDGKTRGYSKEELELLEDVVAGKYGANIARWAGNFLGGGGGLLQYLVSGGAALGGAVLGGPYAAAAAATLVPAAGMGLRAVSNKLTENQARALAAQLRMRSPLYEQAIKNPPTVSGMRPEIRAAMARALLLGGPQVLGASKVPPRAATPAEADLLSPGVY